MQGRMQLMFGCDIRSLAAFRIGIGSLLFVDALVRYFAAESFYSDAGYMSCDLAKYVSPDAYSLNYLSGSVGFQQLIFFLQACSALLLGVGCFTRIATLCCWLLLASIHVRNPMYIIGGDTLLRMLVFWSLFTPLARAWSIDEWRDRKNASSTDSGGPVPGLIGSVGTACLLVQICVMYVTAGLAKWNEPWLNGVAMDYILRQDCYARPLSGWLVQSPMLTSILTRATLFIELFVPFLMFLPFRTAHVRLAGVAFFCAFHLGIELTMDVGKFTYVSMVAWLLFLPPLFWNQLRWATLREHSCPKKPVELDSDIGRLRSRGHFLLTGALPAVLLVYVLIWNFAGLYGGPGSTWLERKPDLFYRLGNVAMLKQNFQMFGIPAQVNTTFLFSGRTASGERVDLVRRTPATESGVGAAHPVSQEWKTLHWYLISFGGDAKIYEALLEYHARTWNRTAGTDQQVNEARLERFTEDLGPGIAPGSFIHLSNLAEWTGPDSGQIPSERLKQDFDQVMDRLENRGLFPLDSD